MAELWVGTRGGILLEPPERRSCRKHHLLGETEDREGGVGGGDWSSQWKAVAVKYFFDSFFHIKAEKYYKQLLLQLTSVSMDYWNDSLNIMNIMNYQSTRWSIWMSCFCQANNEEPKHVIAADHLSAFSTLADALLKSLRSRDPVDLTANYFSTTSITLFVAGWVLCVKSLHPT